MHLGCNLWGHTTLGISFCEFRMTNRFAAPMRKIASLSLGKSPTTLAVCALCLAGAASTAWAEWTAKPSAPDGAVVIASPSTEAVEGLFGREAPAQMTVQCVSNNTSITFRFEETFLSDLAPYGDVTLQIDDTPEQVVTLEKGESDQTLAWASGRQAVPFLVQAMSGRTLTVSVTTFSDDHLAAQFSLDGLTAALEPVRAACNW
jgi:type VI secretion system VasI family protein